MTVIINSEGIDAYVETEITMLVRENDKRFADLQVAFLSNEDVIVIRNGVRFKGKIANAAMTSDPDKEPTSSDPEFVIGQFEFRGRMKE